MKVRKAVRRLCEACFVARRRGKLFVVCKKNPKHKQRQLFHSEAAAAGQAGCNECGSGWLHFHAQQIVQQQQQSSLLHSPLR